MRFVVLAIVMACSPPPHPRTQPGEVEPSGLRGSPQRIELAAGDYAKGAIHAHAPRAGTWWYAVVAEPGRLRITTSSDRLALAWLDVAGAEHPFTKTTSLDDPPREVLVRVTTTKPARFVLSAEVFRDRVAEPAPDAAPLDAAPSTPCNPNEPDFTNPRCCEARCGLATQACWSMVKSIDGTGATIGLGASDEIMTFANGVIYEDKRPLSAVVVLGVKEHESLVKILEPSKVDAKKLATLHVTLSPPDRCRR